MSIRIILAEDHEVMRNGLQALLLRMPDLEIVGSVGNGKRAIEEAKKTHPDIVVMDIRMPSMDGIEATRQLLQISPKTKVLCLSMHRSATCVRTALNAGAAGYLLKDCAVAELIDAIRAVHRGETYVSHGLRDMLKK